MNKDSSLTEAGRHYAAAYASHYVAGDLSEALRLYTGVMTQHPDTREAEYSRTQIQNIAKRVVPMQELLDAQTHLARTHLANRPQSSVN